MEVLDTSIANVALPHIARDLGASTDQGTWVLTSYLSYLVSNAIILPVGALGHRASSVAGTSFCYASPSSPRQVFFAVSPQRSRSCSFHVFSRASEVAASSLWRRPSWRIPSKKRSVAKPSHSMVSLQCLRHPSGRRSAVGSPTTTPGDGSSISICPSASSRSLWSVAWSRIRPGSKPIVPISENWTTSASVCSRSPWAVCRSCSIRVKRTTGLPPTCWRQHLHCHHWSDLHQPFPLPSGTPAG